VPGKAPPLEFNDDPKDWISYFQQGASILSSNPKGALQYFYWASRLDPTHAEPYIGGWYALQVHKRKDTPQGDSLMAFAAWRDPFVHPVRVLQIMGTSLEHPSTSDSAWMALGAAHYDSAADLFARAILQQNARAGSAEETPDDSALAELRWGRALSFHYGEHHDSAVTELLGLDSTLSRGDTAALRPIYRSDEWLHYMVGLSWMAAKNDSMALAAFRQTLGEDSTFYRADAGIGDVALAGGDTAAALEAWRRAEAAFASTNPVRGERIVFCWRYADFLTRAGHRTDAVSCLKALTDIAPDFAAGHLALADALAAAGDVAGSVAQYRAFLVAAPMRLDKEKQRAMRAVAEAK
jgi:tetratricopeptide (TPR) repeat protein